MPVERSDRWKCRSCLARRGQSFRVDAERRTIGEAGYMLVGEASFNA
jgi:hypothetical protein